MSDKSKAKNFKEIFAKGVSIKKGHPKTNYSKNTSDNSKTSTIIVKKQFTTFGNYMNDIKNKYLKEFKQTIKNEDNLEIVKKFEEKMPIISGKCPIQNCNFDINIPDQYFMINIFWEIIKIVTNKDSAYPMDNKYGLAYFYDKEWIFFTIDEIYYQKYISQANQVMSLLYSDYTNQILNPKDLFTKDDKYILPRCVKGLDYERNVFQYFQLKTKLKEGPDVLIKINSKINKNIHKYKKKLNFNEYFDSINNYSYLEIDGALINNTENEIILKRDDNPIIFLYHEIIVNQIENKENVTKYICQNPNNYDNIIEIKIPKNTVIFFQTKSQGPTNILPKDITSFNSTELEFDQMKKELSVVLYKLILYGKYFYELYTKLKIIDNKYKVIFFLIFDNYRIEDISKEIENYINILIDKKKVNYPFTIRQIYMNSSVDLINSKLNSEIIVKEIEEKKRKEEEKKREKEEKKRKKELEEFQKQIKELLEKQEIEEKRREEEEKRRKEEEKKRDEELEKYKKMFDELMKKQESDNRAREEEEKKRREDLEKNEKLNQELDERKASQEINLSNSQVCNNEMKKCALDIKEKIENFINEKFAIYEPIEYRKGY